MRFLLDTNAFFWAAIAPERLTGAAQAAIADERSELLVSAASAWELATKVRLGKLPEAAMLEANFIPAARAAGYVLLPLAVETALRSGRLPGAHRDPFDRMIAAQALELDVPVISPDAEFDSFGVRRLW